MQATGQEQNTGACALREPPPRRRPRAAAARAAVPLRTRTRVPARRPAVRRTWPRCCATLGSMHLSWPRAARAPKGGARRQACSSAPSSLLDHAPASFRAKPALWRALRLRIRSVHTACCSTSRRSSLDLGGEFAKVWNMQPLQLPGRAGDGHCRSSAGIGLTNESPSSSTHLHTDSGQVQFTATDDPEGRTWGWGQIRSHIKTSAMRTRMCIANGLI